MKGPFELGLLALFAAGVCACSQAVRPVGVTHTAEPLQFAYFSHTPGATSPRGEIIVQRGDEVIAKWSVSVRPEFEYDRDLNVISVWENTTSGEEQLRVRFMVDQNREATAAEQRILRTGRSEYVESTGIPEPPYLAARIDDKVEYLLFYTEWLPQNLFELWRYDRELKRAQRILNHAQFCELTDTRIPLGVDLKIGGFELSRDRKLLAIGIPQEAPYNPHNNRYITDTWVLSIENGSLKRVAPGAPVGWTNDGHLLVELYWIPPGELANSDLLLYDATKSSLLKTFKNVSQAHVDGDNVIVVKGWEYGTATQERHVEVWSSDLGTLITRHSLARGVSGWIDFGL